MQSDARWLTAILLIASAGCNETKSRDSGGAATAVATAAAVPEGAANDLPATTLADIRGLSHNKAGEVLVARGWKAGGLSTGPGPGEFERSGRNDVGARAEVAVRVFDSDLAREMARPRAIQDAVFVEHGNHLLTVSVRTAGTLDRAASVELLTALVARAKDPSEPFRVVELPSDSALMPRIETVEKRLVIAPAVVEHALASLKAAGYEDARNLGGQTVDSSNPKDTGSPGVILAASKGTERARLHLNCARADTSEKFWPAPGDAHLGEAIAVRERCAVRVSVEVSERPDAGRAESLLKQLVSRTR
jgi:hypothetical protein